MEDSIQEAMRGRLVGGQLPCAQAMIVASELGLEPATVGAAANQAGIRISRCQLGLFGYGPKAEGKHKIVHAPPEVPGQLAARLRHAATGDGIRCSALWRVADGLSLSRLGAAGAAEALGLRVSHCQLGCFPRPKAGR